MKSGSFLSAPLIACVLAFGCTNEIKPELSEEEIVSIDERAVYATVIRDLFPETGGRKQFQAISDKPFAYVESKSGWTLPDLEVRVEHWVKLFPKADLSAIHSYEYHFERPTAFTEADFNQVHRPLIMIEESKIDQSRPVLPDKQKPNQIYGPRFEDLAPGAEGLIRIARRGFSVDRTQALLKIEYIYCPLCGFGMSMLLKKQNGVWSIVDRSVGWVS